MCIFDTLDLDTRKTVDRELWIVGRGPRTVDGELRAKSRVPWIVNGAAGVERERNARLGWGTQFRGGLRGVS